MSDVSDTKDRVQKSLDTRVAQYVAVRDKIRKIEKEQIEPLKETLNLLSGWIMDFLDQAGVKSAKTADGTCGITTRYSASLADAEAFMDFVKANNRFELLDRRANSTAVKDYVQDTGNLPPGVNLSAVKTISVRRPGDKP
jgi:hypothetical protein